MTKRIDLTGNIYGRLTVLRYIKTVKGKAVWGCLCKCGKTTEVTSDKLRSKNGTKSCGCIMREVNSKNAIKRNTVHGHNKASNKNQTWYSWKSMRSRCEKEYHISYHGYGGRGIKVCERWAQYVNFLEDMGESPEGKTLDRINPNGNYEPENCRWATRSEQQRNRSDNYNKWNSGIIRKEA